jgi:hypothetical protein
VLARHGIELHTDLARAEMATLRASGRGLAMVEEIIEPQPAEPTLSSAMSHLELTLHRLSQQLDSDESVRAREPTQAGRKQRPH